MLKAAADPCTIEQLGALPSGSTEVLMAAFAFIDENGFVIYRCPGCGGASHPATGCAYSATVVWCWSCTVEWARWVQLHTNGKGRRSGIAFYDHVGPLVAGVVADTPTTVAPLRTPTRPG